MKRALGEVDYSGLTRIRPNVHSEPDQWCWVHVRRGNVKEGTGALMHVTTEMQAHGLKVGDVVFFGYGPQKIKRTHYPKQPPKFLRKARVSNKTTELVKLYGQQTDGSLSLVVAAPKRTAARSVQPVAVMRPQQREKQAAILRPLLAAELKSSMLFNPAPPRRVYREEPPRLQVWDKAHHGH